MSTPYVPAILAGDTVYAATPLVGSIVQYNVQSVSGSRLLVTDVRGSSYSIAASAVRKIYRNGLLIWFK